MIKTGIRSSLSKSLSKIIESAVGKMADDLHEEAKRNTPVDTGRARRGWNKTSKGTRNDVPYIKPLDEGSSKKAPNGITKPSINTVINNFKKGKYLK